MPTMVAALMAPTLQDSPAARHLLQRAQGVLQKWPEGFAGFRAWLRGAMSTQDSHGWIQLTPGRRVDVHLHNPTLRCCAQTMLKRLVRERTPAFFKDGDGRYLLTLDAAAEQPWGQCVRVHCCEDEQLAYWIDAAGRIRGCEREAAGQRLVTIFEEYTRATPGRVLPTRVTCTWFDLTSGAQLRSETVVDTHRRVDHVWLPATRHITIATPNGSQIIQWEFAGHTLLGAC